MPAAPLVLRLSEITSSEAKLVGGKAAKLGHLSKHGFRVPDGFVVTTAAQDLTIGDEVLRRIELELSRIDPASPASLNSVSEEIRRIIDKTTLDPSVASAIEKTYEKMGMDRVAVRSSATAEDLDEASFAGQYESYLNIEGVRGILEYTKRCYGSLWTPRAIAYRVEKGIPNRTVKLAVLVQSMVDARSAGVMFTNNPASQAEKEIVIESNFGLGDSVVSGAVAPDRFVVSKPDISGHERVLYSEVGAKYSAVEPSAPGQLGTRVNKLTPEQCSSSSISAREARALAKVGVALEALFGAPQDVEWAIDHEDAIHILQSRPITSTRIAKVGDDEIVWSRGYSDDYWNDNVTPLFFDLLGDQLTHIVNVELNQIMGYKGMSSNLLKLHKAHVYFNLDVLRKKVVNEIPPFLRSEDVLNYFPEGHGAYGKETMRSLPFALTNRVLAEIRVTLLDGNGGMGKTSRVYTEWTRDVFEPFCSQFDMRLESLKQSGNAHELWQLAHELDKVMMGHFRLVRYGIPVHNIGMNLMSSYLLRRFLGNEEGTRLFPLLVTGLEHKTNETNRRMSELVMLARRSPVVSKVITTTPSDGVLGKLRDSTIPECGPFVAEVDRFLAEFGVRGFTREPYYPRWNERTSLIFDVVKPMLAGPEVVVRDTEARVHEQRMRAEKTVERKIRTQRLGGIKWTLFNAILGLARTYIAFRENQRFNLDRWITRNRAVYLEIGKKTVKMGFIDRPEQVFFLRRREIKNIIAGSTTDEQRHLLKEEVNRRETDFHENEDVTPPKFIRGSRLYNDVPADVADTMTGLPASQGIVRAPIRILDSIEDIPSVKSGEILVVPRTDPGWTPVFSLISGLITEMGGVLSHGAVVSREYGIPAVTNIRNACGLLKTGQIVTVDGNTGTVLIHRNEVR